MADTKPVSPQTAEVEPARKAAPKSERKELPPYHVVLLDDNEHTYAYVIDMLQSLFAHGKEKAFELEKQVDGSGRAIVCKTHKERAEMKRDQILGYGCDLAVASCQGSMRALIEPAEQ